MEKKKPKLTSLSARSTVEAEVIPAPIIKKRKRFCPECGERLIKEKRTDWAKNEYSVWACYGLVEPEHNDLPLAKCPYEYEVRV